MKFGEKLTDIRIAFGLTLRECSAKMGVDPSNWSKMERGILPAPKAAIVAKWCSELGAPEAEQELQDLACISRRELPRDITEGDIANALPIMFGAIRKAHRKELLHDLVSILTA